MTRYKKNANKRWIKIRGYSVSIPWLFRLYFFMLIHRKKKKTPNPNLILSALKLSSPPRHSLPLFAEAATKTATTAIVFIPQLPTTTATATVTRCSALLIFLLATPPPRLSPLP
ncbi:uncharacterized protein G2W53_007237 [Senna tora]|uniref:Uncharacterized protein n=1 Tax=Senna tora TaxID=362788 RepID=A0A835CFH2_9FABA|nr:uncharacterized protein G2W53_007237 [Senna tora]